MLLEELEIGHAIELDITVNNKNLKLASSVEQFVAPTLLISPVLSGGKLVGFPPECNIDLQYSDNDKVYVWRNVTIKAVKYNNTIYHSIFAAGDAETVNRRTAYRVYIGEYMPITSFTKDGPTTSEVLIKDISETGFAFITGDAFEIGRVVRLNLTVQNNLSLKLSAQIVRQSFVEGKNDLIYGCKFSERNRLLSNYLMFLQQQRQKARMGL